MSLMLEHGGFVIVFSILLPALLVILIVVVAAEIIMVVAQLIMILLSVLNCFARSKNIIWVFYFLARSFYRPWLYLWYFIISPKCLAIVASFFLDMHWFRRLVFFPRNFLLLPFIVLPVRLQSSHSFSIAIYSCSCEHSNSNREFSQVWQLFGCESLNFTRLLGLLLQFFICVQVDIIEQ